MQNVPKIVRDRLHAAAPAIDHPDADLLTAFAERSLPERERTVVLEHLARCGDCREIVALALPEVESIQTTVRPSPGGWLTWPALRWGFVAAGVVAIASLGALQFQRSTRQQNTASALKQPAPIEIAANEPKKAVDRIVAPADKAEKKEKFQAPATPAFADTVNGVVVSDIEKKNVFHGSSAGVVAPQAAPVVGGNVGATIGGPLPHGPRLLNQYQQQSNVQNQIPPPVPPAFAKQQPIENDRVPAASESVEVSGAAPVTATPDANLDAQLAVNRPAPEADSAYSRAKELPSQTAQVPALRRLEGRAAPGQIGGYVVDSSGAVVSNARVTITPSKPGKPTTAVTDARGEWLIAGLPTGSYKAQASAPGFRTAVVDLNYDANQPKAFAFTLSPGSVSETVDVAAGAVQVQTETNSVGNAINSKAVSQIAINGRNFTDLSPALQPLWAVDAAGALQRSFDKGSTWQTVDVNASGTSLEVSTKTSRAKAKDAGKALKRDTAAALTFRAVYAAGAEVWAGGSAGALYHSQDVGNHWTRVFPASGGITLTGDILTLEFTDAQHGQLSTSTSEVWITADAGQTWQKQ
jgi:Carboxypeptidase regulatory-like domain/Photosynthesis system II assembly factor YCF48/Putative zinc-finger